MTQPLLDLEALVDLYSTITNHTDYRNLLLVHYAEGTSVSIRLAVNQGSKLSEAIPNILAAQFHSELEMLQNSCPPWNFSWVVQEKLAAMAWPQTEANLKFILQNGVKHLVTLSPEKIPPVKQFPDLKWTLISVQEFEAPSLDQVVQFIEICEEADGKNEGVGVHCRQGRGRTGVMAACYLVRFQDLPPDRAVTTLRLDRPGSIETYMQEKAVFTYYDFLRKTRGHVYGKGSSREHLQ